MLRASLALLVSALALASTAPVDCVNCARGTLTAATLQAIAPASASCNGAPAPGECHTAAQGAPAIQASFTKYNINSVGEQAAAIALMIYESDSFKYNKN